jgi:O-acetyl-ADP-ribose deacetylase (regulator of RNase III)
VKIEYVAGYAIDQDADFIVNSANNSLILATSGAGRIREISPQLNLLEWLLYQTYLFRISPTDRKRFRRLYRKHNWLLTRAQLSSLKILGSCPEHRAEQGNVFLDHDWSRSDQRTIVHVVTTFYKSTTVSKSERILPTAELIENCLEKSLDLAEKHGAQVVALPIMCARNGYGLDPETSFQITEKVLKRRTSSSIEKIIVCFDNEETQEYLASLE